MERHEIMELLGQLKLAGMRTAYDEVVAAGVRAQHPFQRIFGELLLAQRLQKPNLRPVPRGSPPAAHSASPRASLCRL